MCLLQEAEGDIQINYQAIETASSTGKNGSFAK